MYYFVKKDGVLCLTETEFFPEDLESLYQSVRTKYTIEYDVFDWADDDSDAGMGYCYDNSYSLRREPYRHEMIIENGEIVGFYVGSIRWDLTNDFVLPLKQNAKFYTGGTSSVRYGNSQKWVLQIEEHPAPCEYVFLRYVPHKDKNEKFSPAFFSEELVESIKWQCYIEDTRGNFNGASRFRLKLTSKAINNPDLVLSRLEKYSPILVRE